MRTLRFACMLLLLFGAAAPGACAEIAADTGHDEYSPANILGFTRALISKREFYRAYIELKRLDSFHPGFLPESQSHITALFLMYRGGELDGILSGSSAEADPRTRCIGKLFKCDVYLARHDFASAVGILGTGCDDDAEDLRIMFRKRLFMASLIGSGGAREWNDQGSDRGADKAVWDELARYAGAAREKEKDARIAMVWGIIPGMGYVYAGNRPTGILACIFISAFAGLSYFSFKTNNAPLGILFGVGATVFYGGSVIGGYREALRANLALRERTAARFSEDLRLEQDREKIFSGYGIGHGK